MSAALRTVERLADALDLDLVWRKRELLTWSSLLLDAKEHEQQVLLRGAWALLYAHLEGYVKIGSTNYLEHVSRQGLSLGALRAELAAIALRGVIADAAAAKQNTAHTQLVTSVRADSLPANLPFDSATIKTYSNLSFEVLEDILWSLGCDALAHEHLRDELNKRLLKHRNDIAHGRRPLVDLNDWLHLRNGVVAVMDDVRTQLSNAAALRTYLR